MSYLRYDKTILTNLEQSLSLEMLRTNKSGAYHCTTLVGCNTRKYHGLLVIPVPSLDNGNHVLLSSLDETVIQHGAEFNLGLHKYWGDNYAPNGHKYMREFNCDVLPCGIYRVGGVILSKEKVFVSYENRILIKYTLLQANSPTTLRFSPFLAFRSVNDLCVENYQLDSSYREIKNGISTCLYQGYPTLYMQFNKPVTFTPNPHWNKGIEYPREAERGYYNKEDLFVPGTFEVSIKQGESVIFSAGISETDTECLHVVYYEEVTKRTTRTSFFNCLKNSAQQFYNKKSDSELYLLSGYPWFKCVARDMFISLPGVSLAVDDMVSFEKVMDTMIPQLRSFMEEKPVESEVVGLTDPDVLLWVIWDIQEYAKATSNGRAWQHYGDFLKEIIEFILKGKHPNLMLKENGLVYSDGEESAHSWMYSKWGGNVLTPRRGYVVEFNALWYNALCFVAELSAETGNEYYAEQLRVVAGKAQKSFTDVFWTGFYLYDYVINDYREQSVRPNMLWAVALKYSPLENNQKKSIIDISTKELLTPRGLRSLSPKSQNYHGNADGGERDRVYASFQGCVWPWLMGVYIEGYLNVYKNSGLSFVSRRIEGFEEEMHVGCIGTLSEMYDGNPPFRGRGGISYAMNVAELLRALKILKNYNK